MKRFIQNIKNIWKVEELGFYNPRTKEVNINVSRIKVRLNQGAQPTPTVESLLKKAGISR